MTDFLGGFTGREQEVLGRRDTATEDVQDALRELLNPELISAEPASPERTPVRTIAAALADALHQLGRGTNQAPTRFSQNLLALKERRAERKQRSNELAAERANRQRLSALRAQHQSAENSLSSSRADVRAERGEASAQAREDRGVAERAKLRKNADDAADARLDKQYTNNLKIMRERARLLGDKGPNKNMLQSDLDTRDLMEGLLAGGADGSPDLETLLNQLPKGKRAEFIRLTRLKMRMLTRRRLTEEGADELEENIAEAESIIQRFEDPPVVGGGEDTTKPKPDVMGAIKETFGLGEIGKMLDASGITTPAPLPDKRFASERSPEELLEMERKLRGLIGG